MAILRSLRSLRYPAGPGTLGFLECLRRSIKSHSLENDLGSLRDY